MLFSFKSSAQIVLSVVTFCLFCNTFNYREHDSLTIEVLNNELTKLSRHYDIDILDTYTIYLDNKGMPDEKFFLQDGLHLTKEGYVQWIEYALKPYLSDKTFKTIAMVGNSITKSIECYNFSKGKNKGSNWELLLEIPAYNLGVGGNNSYDVIDRVDNIISYEAECYFILVGINDIYAGYPVWVIVKNIEIIIKMLKKTDSTIVLQYIMPIRIDV